MEKIKILFTRFKNYLKEVWSEIDPKTGKVTWPKQQEVVGSTIIVMISIFAIGLSIGLIDNILSRIFDLVLR